MKGHDCFICEADIFVKDKSIFDKELNHSCYFGKMIKGYSDDWVFNLDKAGRIIRVCKCGKDVFNMVGISFFKKRDVGILAEAVHEIYADEKNGNYYWDEVVDKNLDKLDLTIHEVYDDQICEFDTIEELAKVDKGYKCYIS